MIADNAHLDARGRSDAVRQWADALDPLDLTTLAMVDPARVGNLDGMPNDVRYASNQVNLARAVESERQRVADWLPPPDKDDSDWAAYQRLSRRIEVMEQLLLDRPYDGSTPVSGLGRAHYQVLSFEPPTYSGDDVVDDGRLAVVVGDLDTARDVGVVVPGITNRIDNFNATLEKADNVQALVPDSATIAWLGYDTPEFEDSVTTGDAERGARALQDFIEGMRRAEQSEVAVLAHSYGTLVRERRCATACGRIVWCCSAPPASARTSRPPQTSGSPTATRSSPCGHPATSSRSRRPTGRTRPTCRA